MTRYITKVERLPSDMAGLHIGTIYTNELASHLCKRVEHKELFGNGLAIASIQSDISVLPKNIGDAQKQNNEKEIRIMLKFELKCRGSAKNTGKADGVI